MKTKPRIYTQALRWRTQPASHWPEWAKAWLGLPGSLTQHMQLLHTTLAGRGNMQVQCTHQGVARIPAHWFGRQHSKNHRPQRWVVLHAAGQPRVVALSMLGGPSAPPTSHEWRFWHTLGQQPLGSTLFSIHGLRKGPTHCAVVRARIGPCNTIAYARRTHYLQPPYRTPLWLIELFLPNLAHAPYPQHPTAKA